MLARIAGLRLRTVALWSASQRQQLTNFPLSMNFSHAAQLASFFSHSSKFSAVGNSKPYLLSPTAKVVVAGAGAGAAAGIGFFVSMLLIRTMP